MTKRLEENGIETRPFFYPMHVMPPYKNEEKFPVAEEIARKGVNLPSGVNLMKEMIERVVNTIKGITANLRYMRRMEV